MIETLAHGYSSRVLSESFPMNTNMTGFRWFSKNFASLLNERSLSIERVKRFNPLMLTETKSSLTTLMKSCRQSIVRTAVDEKNINQDMINNSPSNIL